METNIPSLPTTLYPSQLRSLFMVLLCVIFTGLGIMITRDGSATGYLISGFFGVGSIILITNLNLKASYLRLEEDGFTFCSLFRTHHIRWIDVAGFGVAKIRSRNMVMWNFGQTYQGKGGLRSVNQVICGFDAGLPNNYGKSAYELCALMEALRQQQVRHTVKPFAG